MYHFISDKVLKVKVMINKKGSIIEISCIGEAA